MIDHTHSAEQRVKGAIAPPPICNVNHVTYIYVLVWVTVRLISTKWCTCVVILEYFPTVFVLLLSVKMAALIFVVSLFKCIDYDIFVVEISRFIERERERERELISHLIITH